MKLFVTGGTGFIGSHFVERALTVGHDLVCLRHKADKPRIALSREPEWIDGDLTGDYANALQKSDALVHFAAVGVSPQAATWEELFRVNVAQSVALLRKAVECGVQRFLICGSCFEYGLAARRFAFIPVDAPLMPVNGYGASKAAASIAALTMAAEFGVRVDVVRPFNVFGEGQHESNFWPSLRRAAISGNDFPMTSGEQVRDFAEVGAVVEAVLKVLEKKVVLRNAIITNIGSGIPMTLLQFAEHWWREFEATGKLLAGAIPHRAQEIERFVPEL